MAMCQSIGNVPDIFTVSTLVSSQSKLKLKLIHLYILVWTTLLWTTLSLFMSTKSKLGRILQATSLQLLPNLKKTTLHQLLNRAQLLKASYYWIMLFWIKECIEEYYPAITFSKWRVMAQDCEFSTSICLEWKQTVWFEQNRNFKFHDF